jgi:protein TonB
MHTHSCPTTVSKIIQRSSQSFWHNKALANLRSKCILATVLLAHVCIVFAFFGTQINKPATPPTLAPTPPLVVSVVKSESPTHNIVPKVVEHKKPHQKEQRQDVPSQPPVDTSIHSNHSPTPHYLPEATPASAPLPAVLAIGVQTTPNSQAYSAQTAPKFDADYLDNPAPTYPSLSRRAGEEGKVVLRVFVEASGVPSKIDINTSSGFDRLDKTAVSTVARWKFIPARQGADAIGAWVLVPIIFDLKN